MENKKTNSDGVSPFQIIIFTVAAAILSVFGVLGLIVWFAINGNLYALGILIVLGVLLVILSGGVIVWITMWVNQKQDERAANAQLKVTTAMMNQQAMLAGNVWQQNMLAMVSGFKAQHEQQKAIAAANKNQPQITATAPPSEGEYLEIGDMEIDL